MGRELSELWWEMGTPEELLAPGGEAEAECLVKLPPTEAGGVLL